jgi:DNA-binding transcriptional ArsR family regulator
MTCSSGRSRIRRGARSSSGCAARGEQTVGALTAQAGVSQPAVSKHLAVLKQAGLVRDRHAGRQTHYSADAGALTPLVDWTNRMSGFWQSRFDGLEDLLKRMDQ